MREKICIDDIVFYKKDNLVGKEVEEQFRAVGLTKASNISKHMAELINPLLHNKYNCERVGLIWAAQYPNISNIAQFNQLVQRERVVSTQLFPHATPISVISSVAIAYKIKGMSYTINQGALGFFQACKIAEVYLKCKILDMIIIIVGDEYIEEIGMKKNNSMDSEYLGAIVLIRGEKQNKYYIQECSYLSGQSSSSFKHPLIRDAKLSIFNSGMGALKALQLLIKCDNEQSQTTHTIFAERGSNKWRLIIRKT